LNCDSFSSDRGCQPDRPSPWLPASASDISSKSSPITSFKGKITASKIDASPPDGDPDFGEGHVSLSKSEVTLQTNKSPNFSTPAVLGVADTAHWLGVCRTTVYDLVNRGRLRPIKIGRRTVFSVAGLQQFLHEQEKENYHDKS
jgi:excisionase family DNA binding protein